MLNVFIFFKVVKVFSGSLPQHSGLLHQPPHGEEDFHAVHGGVQRPLHPHVHPGDGLPRLQAHHQTGKGPARERQDHVCRESPAQDPLPAPIPVSGRPDAGGQQDESKQEGKDSERAQDHISIVHPM